MVYRFTSVAGGQEASMSTPRICSHCNTIVPDGHHYCGRCGTLYEEGVDSSSHTLFYGPMQAPGRAKLILIHGDGMEGMSYYLNATHHRCGRGDGVIPFDDPYISPTHTDFFYRDNALYVQDEGSVNGTYVRLREPMALEDGDMIRAGLHVFRFERLKIDDEVVAEDGTVHYASPPMSSSFRIHEVLDGGLGGSAYASPHGDVSVGREGCDMSFADDPHLSRRHFKISETESGHIITDLDSKNGTFLRIRESHPLQDGDYVFVGRQLLRVEIS